MADLAGVNGTRKDFRVVGKPNLPGVLSWSQATGVAKFGIDYVVPDMLHAKFLRSPYANARIKALTSRKPRPSQESSTSSPGKTKTSRSWAAVGGGFMGGPPQAFLDNQADQEGAEVGVIVVAENADICEEALGRSTWNGKNCLSRGPAQRTGTGCARSSGRLPRQGKEVAAGQEWEEATIPPRKAMSPIPTRTMAMSKKGSGSGPYHRI